ncbi:MAG: hypothetical protein EOP04_30580 [Proteobacteria bacterium]|nr:MAG: hypothetical protein EOP04_30580 [Pseudomonadota bacterium]
MKFPAVDHILKAVPTLDIMDARILSVGSCRVGELSIEYVIRSSAKLSRKTDHRNGRAPFATHPCWYAAAAAGTAHFS